tara:strand:- start:31384 stop:31593 length:210 start_codon:yes stop_codon:yes gene_type:complete
MSKKIIGVVLMIFSTLFCLSSIPIFIDSLNKSSYNLDSKIITMIIWAVIQFSVSLWLGYISFKLISSKK